jgi:hypothetical protein
MRLCPSYTDPLKRVLARLLLHEKNVVTLLFIGGNSGQITACIRGAAQILAGGPEFNTYQGYK